MKKLSLKNEIGYGALALLVLIQFFQIDKSNSGVVEGKDIGEASSIPDEVHVYLQNTCYD